MAVPVGLDHRHGGGAGCGGAPGEDPDVVPDRIEIDHQFDSWPAARVLHPGHPRIPATDRRARIASVRAAWIAEAGTGALLCVPPRAASAAANSWACTAAAAATAGSRPAASNAPSTPVRTSP